MPTTARAVSADRLALQRGPSLADQITTATIAEIQRADYRADLLNRVLPPVEERRRAATNIEGKEIVEMVPIDLYRSAYQPLAAIDLPPQEHAKLVLYLPRVTQEAIDGPYFADTLADFPIQVPYVVLLNRLPPAISIDVRDEVRTLFSTFSGARASDEFEKIAPATWRRVIMHEIVHVPRADVATSGLANVYAIFEAPLMKTLREEMTPFVSSVAPGIVAPEEVLIRLGESRVVSFTPERRRIERPLSASTAFLMSRINVAPSGDTA